MSNGLESDGLEDRLHNLMHSQENYSWGNYLGTDDLQGSDFRHPRVEGQTGEGDGGSINEKWRLR